MSHSAPTIQTVIARAVVAPLARPVRTAMGCVPSAPLVLIDVLMSDGVCGSAYIFAYTSTALGALQRITLDVGAELKGQTAEPLERWAALDRRFRLLGWQGLVGMAVSGIDMALWDAFAKRQGLPVAAALGSGPKPIQAYDSYGVVHPASDAAALEASVARGFRAIKIKLGDGDLAQDLACVSGVRGIVGPDIGLMVDYNQSLHRPEAIRRVRALERFDLIWVEEPVKAEDLSGHAAVRAATSIPIQTGENWWFPQGGADALAAGACDFAMPDLMKIGGITGWMQVAALASLAGVPVSSHLFMEASAHALAATPSAHWIEHLDIAGAVLAGETAIIDGAITARGPGLGIVWDEQRIAKLSS